MKIFFVKKRTIATYFLIFILTSVSILYTQGITPRTIQVFMNPERQLPIYSVETPEKKIAISFDAAWGDEYTQEILDILEEHNIKSTFFLVGFWVDKYPHQVKKIFDEGHEIGNHSSTHPDMAKISQEEIIKELNVTGEKIEKIIGKKPILLRPPYGAYNNTLLTTAKEEGYYTIQWDVDSLDWKELGVEPMVERVTSKVKNGSIVLFHNNAKYLTQALPNILKTLQDEGYEIIPISELIYKEDYHIDHEGRQHKN
ncbi:polysaccharide deacetylase family sporulation protein PdaB [Irregularibacter muris]|uniref:Polysaccharide deacetylase family sporulation protein PdaB n=1 Tax=Irregularibacter muris TaxID=1796619 RepID=A0AAE3HJD9_9FIRM|nr:polysaccharide deacetylase family sporulation protein PdaB [Irregularibacter muris]MCR1899798.1 polysaccharide deacetylase family sporulation protein PdaB [Irregularibacter muris]